MTPGSSLMKCTVPKKVYNMVTTAEILFTHSKPRTTSQNFIVPSSSERVNFKRGGKV